MSDKSVNTVVSLDSAKIINKGFREIIYQLEFERANGQELAVVEVFNIPKNRRFRYDIPLLVDGYTPPPFLIYEPFKNIPYFNAYINKGSQIRLGNVFKNQDSFEINGRTSNALTPIPPFDEKNRMPPKNNPIDTLYGAVQNELFTFYNEGVYHINSATNPDKKLAIYVADEYYPYFGAYDKMITPLIFLSTNEEYQNMTLATDQRIGFENFVRETISGNDQIAKDFIKYYYRRIRKSARLFTEDREGWKTDRGMIYQIFGDPLQVFRNEKNELWVYSNSSGNRLRFTFDIEFEDGIKKHRLVRGKRYKEDWMTAVTQWRSGRIIE
jgi:GWxTD domain-containing protein